MAEMQRKRFLASGTQVTGGMDFKPSPGPNSLSMCAPGILISLRGKIVLSWL